MNDTIATVSGKAYPVAYNPASEEALTAERLERTYEPGGPVLAPLMHVYAVGTTPFEAIAALAERLEWGIIEDYREMQNSGAPLSWGYAFRADGTGMKAAGFHVPGGAVLTWWA